MFYVWPALSVLLYLSSKTFGQYVETIAGSGSTGNLDGRGSEARFNRPNGIEVDSSGNIYICDMDNNRIRKVSSLGAVTTVAGSGQASFADGPALRARFKQPVGLTLDSVGNIYVADTVNNRIRKISPSGEVSTVCGSSVGFADGNCTTSQFIGPRGISMDSEGNLYVADFSNHRIRKISPSGSVSTFAGGGYGFFDGSLSSSRFNQPRSLTIDSQGNIYVVDSANIRIRKISSGIVSTLAGTGVSGSSTAFLSPCELKLDSSGVLYVTDVNSGQIQKVTMDGVATTFAGSINGFADGPIAKAQFHGPTGISLDKFGNIYIGDQYNHRIRKIIVPKNIDNNIPALLTQLVLPVSTNGTGDIVAHASGKNNSLFIGFSSTKNPVQLFGPDGTLIYEARRTVSNTISNQTWGILTKLSNNTLVWVHQIEGNGEVFISDVAACEPEAVYVVGSYTGTISFSNQTQNLTAATLQAIGPNQNGFIAKYSSNGTLLWTVAVRGSPLHLTVETWNDSPIVTIKFAKQNATEVWSCIIVPTSGEILNLSVVNYGMVVVRFSPNGTIEWSRLLNFAPWERNQTLSVSQNGEISLTGWCFLTCQLYEGNETTSKYAFPSPNSGSNAVNIILSMNGTLKTWSPLSKYFPIRLHSRFSCGIGVRKSNVTFLSYGTRNPIELKGPATLNLVAVNDIAFLSVDKQQRFVMNLSEFSELIFNLDAEDVSWTSCGRFDSILGPQNTRGDLQNGTFKFEMDSQLGFLSEFSVPLNSSDNGLIRFRPLGRFSFQCGLFNGSHTYFISIRSAILQASIYRFFPETFILDDEIVEHNVYLDGVSSSVIALTMISEKVTFYIDGTRFFDFEFINASKFLFTTIDSQGSVDRMGIMALPYPLEPWLMNPDEPTVSSVFTDADTFPKTAHQIRMNPTSTNEVNNLTGWTLFGLSGTLLYIVLGVCSFVVAVLVAGAVSVTMIKLKRRRRLKEGNQNTMMTFTAGGFNGTGYSVDQNYTVNQTLVNTELDNALFKH